MRGPMKQNKKPGQPARGWPEDPGNFDWFNSKTVQFLSCGLNHSPRPKVKNSSKNIPDLIREAQPKFTAKLRYLMRL